MTCQIHPVSILDETENENTPRNTSTALAAVRVHETERTALALAKRVKSTSAKNAAEVVTENDLVHVPVLDQESTATDPMRGS